MGVPGGRVQAASHAPSAGVTDLRSIMGKETLKRIPSNSHFSHSHWVWVKAKHSQTARTTNQPTACSLQLQHRVGSRSRVGLGASGTGGCSQLALVLPAAPGTAQHRVPRVTPTAGGVQRDKSRGRTGPAGAAGKLSLEPAVRNLSG